MNHIHINDNTKVKKLMVIGQCGISYLLVQHQKISEIIAKYRSKSSDYDSTKKFIFNAKDLSLFLNSTVGQMGMGHESSIFVVTTANVRGA